MITSEQRYWWRVALELKLRKSSGDAFQGFFSDVMLKLYGSDYVRTRPFGALGDKGCDGYRQSSGEVYQCYGALNADGGKVAYLISKMDEDFGKAKGALSDIMKEWHMVHNLVDGLPIEAVQKLNALKKAHAPTAFGFIGMEGFEERIFSLEPLKIEDLLGIAATSQDAQNMQLTELRDLIAGVAAATDDVTFDVSTIKPVPPEKLDINNLPSHWRALIASGWQNTHLVAAYLNKHPNPLIGEKIAQVFRVRYEYLKSQNLTPGAIMSGLYEAIVGIGTAPAPRQVAAQALLAFLFESCDIFEGLPQTQTIQ